MPGARRYRGIRTRAPRSQLGYPNGWMTASLTARRPMIFLGVAAAAMAAECAVVGSRGFALHPVPFSAVVVFDLVVALPAAWWFFVIRPGAARPRSIVPAGLVGIALAAALLPEQRGALRALRFAAIPAELILVTTAVRRFCGAGGDLPDRLRAAVGDGLLARIAAKEVAILGLALFSWKSRPAPGTLSVHRRSGWTAIFAAVLVMSVPETAGLHLLIARWSTTAAWVATALGIYGVVWLLGDLRALQLRGVTVTGGVLRIRIGIRREADVPLASIAAVEEGAAPGAERLAVLGAPVLTLRLREPVEVRPLFGKARRATALALQVDDPAALRALVTR